jgi:hypothetical protein
MFGNFMDDKNNQADVNNISNNLMMNFPGKSITPIWRTLYG